MSSLSVPPGGDAAGAERFLEHWLSELASAPDARALFAVADRELSNLGLDRLIYLMVDEHSSESRVHSTMPSWWLDQYQDEQLATHDPFLRHCCRSYRPTATGEAFLDRYDFLGADERRFIAKGGDAGLRAGLAVPMRVAGTGQVGGFNVGGSCSKRELNSLLREFGQAIRIGLLHTHQAIDRMRAPAPRLSSRELQCLALLASGLQNKQIASQLAIAGSTVELHLRNARRKLDAQTREQAVARAIWLGLIAL